MRAIVLEMMLAAAMAPMAHSPLAGTWNGTINGLPGVEIKIDDAGERLSGLVTFYFQRRGPDGKWRVEGKYTQPLLAPKVEGKILSFEVAHHKVHGGTEWGPNVGFRMELTGGNVALLRYANPRHGDLAPMKLTRHRGGTVRR